MRATIEIFVISLLVLATAQCRSAGDKGKSAVVEACMPSSVRRCVGEWSCRGDQVCRADGTWSACVCDGAGAVAGYDAGVGLDAGGAVDSSLVEASAVTPSVLYVLLDDMEGTTAPNGPVPFSASGLGVAPGFWGGWRSSGHASNTMSPDPYAYSALPAPHQTMEGVTSLHAAHLACHVADLYGYCEQGFWLAQSSGTASSMASRAPVDLSAFQGFVFWAMASKATRLKVLVEDAETDALGGRCGQLDASADQCGDAFSRPLSLTDTWKRYEVKWSELSQRGWGHVAPSGKLDPSAVYIIGFQVDGPQGEDASAVDADFWIDDIYLVQATQIGDTPNPCIAGADDLIADFRDSGRLNLADGRKGSFYVYGDSQGTFVPAKVDGAAYPIDQESGNDQCSGPGSFHTKAAGFADWGAAISTDLMAKSGGAKGTYDASKYRGISFWAKASAPIDGVKVSFPDIYTDGGADPRTIDPSAAPCVFESGSRRNCSPYLVKFGDSDFPAYKDHRIDTAWKRFDILFADTQQDFFNPGFHTAEDKLDTRHLTSINLQISARYVDGVARPNDFEIWIDDVYFIK